MTTTPEPRPSATNAKDCPRCGQPVDGHTVAALRGCLSDLHDHDLPFESTALTWQNLDVVNAGSVAVKAGVHDSPIGTHPVLVFEFTAVDGPLPAIALILDDTHMRSVRTLVGSAVDAAVKAARRRRTA